MIFFLLPLVLLVVLLLLAIAVGTAVVRAVRSAMLLRGAQFQLAPEELRPGEGARAWARVMPRERRPTGVRALLTCTMFDHRPRVLYCNAHQLAPVFGQEGQFAAFVHLPAYALRTGAVGDQLSNLFSEDAHRLLILWSVDFEVHLAEQPDVVLARQTLPLFVPEGRPLHADRAYMSQLIVDTCSAMQNDLVFNWLVHLAAADGVIDPTEKELLHDVLRSAYGVTEPAAAEARIAVEMQRDLHVEPALLRKNLPPEALVSFYRFLYAMAWRDGSMHAREHEFLVGALEKFGLDPQTVERVEREVVHGMARQALE